MTRATSLGIVSRLLSVPALVFLLASCGAKDERFRGTFTGTALGQACTVELTPADGQLTGQVVVAGATCPFRGRIEGDRLSGTTTNPALGLEVKVEARLEGDTLRWTAHMPDPMSGTTTPVTVDLTRARAGAAGDPASAAAGSLDPRVVGNWRRTVDQSIKSGAGDSRNDLSMATDIYCTLGADGSYRFGGAQSAFSAQNALGGASGGAGPAPVTTGKWKAENQVLYGMPQGSTQWTVTGRYSVSSDALLLYLPNGQQQYWERQ